MGLQDLDTEKQEKPLKEHEEEWPDGPPGCGIVEAKIRKCSKEKGILSCVQKLRRGQVRGGLRMEIIIGSWSP